MEDGGGSETWMVFMLTRVYGTGKAPRPRPGGKNDVDLELNWPASRSKTETPVWLFRGESRLMSHYPIVPGGTKYIVKSMAWIFRMSDRIVPEGRSSKCTSKSPEQTALWVSFQINNRLGATRGSLFSSQIVNNEKSLGSHSLWGVIRTCSVISQFGSLKMILNTKW